jgi:hypothetical protein
MNSPAAALAPDGRTMPKPRKKTAKRNTQIRIETDLTPEQLEKLSKLFTARGGAEIEIPISPKSIIKVKKD